VTHRARWIKLQEVENSTFEISSVMEGAHVGKVSPPYPFPDDLGSGCGYGQPRCGLPPSTKVWLTQRARNTSEKWIRLDKSVRKSLLLDSVV